MEQGDELKWVGTRVCPYASIQLTEIGRGRHHGEDVGLDIGGVLVIIMLHLRECKQ